jgi:hypothetical protein
MNLWELRSYPSCIVGSRFVSKYGNMVRRVVYALWPGFVLLVEGVGM